MESKNGFRIFLGMLAVLAVLSFFWKPSESPDNTVGAEVLPPPPPERMGDSIDVSLADLLNKPRPELAALADEWATKVQLLDKAYRDGTLRIPLLPDFRLPLAVPVWREANFSAQEGFSLPPYLAAGTHDSDVALHLARFGDVDAALQLADPADETVKARIEACRYERNYPVEWTRLTGLMLHAAQVRLASNELDGGTELVVLHRQLRGLLDAKAANGPLGAVLLPRGHKALALAAAAWRRANKFEVADQADAAFKDWGEMPAPAVAVVPGVPRAQVARLLRSPGEGHTIVALAPTRALDLYALPVPGDRVQAVIANCDAADCLAEVLVIYRAHTNEYFPDPPSLAQLLEDHNLSGRETSQSVGFNRLQYRLEAGYPPTTGVLLCDYAIVSRLNGIGAFVRFSGEAYAPVPPVLPRDFGAVSLDRSFEQNRVRLIPEQRGEVVQTERRPALAQVTNPLKPLPLTHALLRKNAEHDVLDVFTLGYGGEQGVLPPLYQVALPLWAAYGPGRFEGVEDDHGGNLALVWEDSRTRYTLRLPYTGSQGAELDVRDRRSPDQQEARAAAARAADQAERKSRLAAGKPQARLPRSLELEAVQLGMTRDQVRQELPGNQSVLKRTITDGLSVTFAGEADRGLTYVPRQMVLRFDAADRLVELRMRYQEGPAARTSGWTKDLLANLKKRCGAPGEVPSTAAALWPEFTAKKSAPLFYRWLDDVTVMTCSVEASGVEVTLRNCTAEHELGQPLPPLEELTRGPEGCKLGDTREKLQRIEGATKLAGADDALVLPTVRSGPYDALLVWFDQERAMRIVARHKPRPGEAGSPTQLGQAVRDAWFRDIRILGWPQRWDYASPEVLQSLGWQDDRTRLRLFWQDNSSSGPRVFTEWKELSKP